MSLKNPEYAPRAPTLTRSETTISDSDDDEPTFIDVTDETEEERIQRWRREEEEERAERERRRWEIPRISARNLTNISLDELLEQERKFLKEKKGIVIESENHNWMRGNRISQEFSNWLNLHDYIVLPSVELLCNSTNPTMGIGRTFKFK